MKKIGPQKDLKAAQRHEMQLKKLEKKAKLQEIKAKGRNERKLAKIRKKNQAAATKTISRSASAAISAGATASSQSERYRSEAEKKKWESMADVAKYSALIGGNINGTNAVDPSKEGSKGTGKSNSSSNQFDGWY